MEWVVYRLPGQSVQGHLQLHRASGKSEKFRDAPASSRLPPVPSHTSTVSARTIAQQRKHSTESGSHTTVATPATATQDHASGETFPWEVRARTWDVSVSSRLQECEGGNGEIALKASGSEPFRNVGWKCVSATTIAHQNIVVQQWRISSNFQQIHQMCVCVCMQETQCWVRLSPFCACF